MSKPIIVFSFFDQNSSCLAVSFFSGFGGGRGVNPEKQQFRLVQKHVIPLFSESS